AWERSGCRHAARGRGVPLRDHRHRLVVRLRCQGRRDCPRDGLPGDSDPPAARGRDLHAVPRASRGEGPRRGPEAADGAEHGRDARQGADRRHRARDQRHPRAGAEVHLRSRRQGFIHRLCQLARGGPARPTGVGYGGEQDLPQLWRGARIGRQGCGGVPLLRQRNLPEVDRAVV
ncbi:MAG: hypothetical protein AVDCRST_MAG18-4903, partial [uncultured Thermomicrobiales bacterium]